MNNTLMTLTTAAAMIMMMAAAANAGDNASTVSQGTSIAAVTAPSSNTLTVTTSTRGYTVETHDDEIYQRDCNYFRKRAQWSNAHIWWAKYNQCLNLHPGS